MFQIRLSVHRNIFGNFCRKQSEIRVIWDLIYMQIRAHLSRCGRSHLLELRLHTLELLLRFGSCRRRRLRRLIELNRCVSYFDDQENVMHS